MAGLAAVNVQIWRASVLRAPPPVWIGPRELPGGRASPLPLIISPGHRAWCLAAIISHPVIGGTPRSALFGPSVNLELMNGFSGSAPNEDQEQEQEQEQEQHPIIREIRMRCMDYVPPSTVLRTVPQIDR